MTSHDPRPDSRRRQTETGANPAAATLLVLALATFPLALGCGGTDAPPPASSTPAPAAAGPAAGELTAAQIEHGIGPIQSVTLGAVDPTLAAHGHDLFSVKCSSCHKVDARYVGPALEEVLSRRTPEFVMNMMLNPAEMVAKHPAVKQLLGQLFIPMADQQLTEADARAVLEYLRSVQVPKGTSAAGPDGLRQVAAQ